MLKRTIIFMTFVGIALVGHTQSVALFSVDQPPQFLVDAGEDQTFSGSELSLGGLPVATGGGAEYYYAWEPADGLVDPNVANPILQELSVTTLFTVTVTDVFNGCVKTGAVEVVFDLSTNLGELTNGMVIVYPNPAENEVSVEAKENIASVTLRSLIGQEVIRSTYPASSTTKLNIEEVPDGLYLLTISFATGHQITNKLCKASSVR